MDIEVTDVSDMLLCSDSNVVDLGFDFNEDDMVGSGDGGNNTTAGEMVFTVGNSDAWFS